MMYIVVYFWAICVCTLKDYIHWTDELIPCCVLFSESHKAIYTISIGWLDYFFHCFNQGCHFIIFLTDFLENRLFSIQPKGSNVLYFQNETNQFSSKQTKSYFFLLWIEFFLVWLLENQIYWRFTFKKNKKKRFLFAPITILNIFCFVIGQFSFSMFGGNTAS